MSISEVTLAPLTLVLFGPIQVLVHGQTLPRLRSRKGLWLLALLTLRHGRPVEREWLAGTLWPDVDQEQAFANLRPVLSELRKALGSESERLQSPNRHTLNLELTGVEVDVLRFDAAIASKKLPALEQAVALYHGPLLEGCMEEWVPQERDSRAEDCLQALQLLSDAAMTARDYESATRYSRRAVALDPWRDATRRSLMEALAQSGDKNAALQVYREFTELLRDDPKASPDEQTSALYTRLRTETRRAPETVQAKASVITAVVNGYLPHPLTDLIGREDERLEVAAKLRRSRLVTLTGPGGIGKTRLAVEVASEIAREFADGVWLVALDTLTDSTRVSAHVASAFGLQETVGQTSLQNLTEHLRHKRLLLVLDNCEHMLEASAQVTGSLLRECRDLRVLTTSREALGITGESAWSVPALAVPDTAHLPTGEATLLRVLMGYESVQLFVERAQAVQKSFRLTSSNALLLAQICERLAGIPLAIELAAARVKAMTVAQIAERLDDHVSLLTGGNRMALSRQQTLRATLDWSYELLTDQEQILLERLSVFSGSWSLEAAEGVCIGEEIVKEQILDLLTSLVDKSLLMFEERDPDVGGRYRLLEMVQQYASARLLAHGMQDLLRARHRDWFTSFAQKAEPELRRAEQQIWLRRLETEHSNFRVALSWTDTDADGVKASLRLAGALWWFWYVRGYLSEGRQHLAQILAREETQEATSERAKALNASGTLACIQGDHTSGQAFFEECLRVFQELLRQDDTVEYQQGIASSLGNLGNVTLELGDYITARTHFEESLSIFRALGQQRQTAASLGNLGQVAYLQEDYMASKAMHLEALSIFRELQDNYGIGLSLHGLGQVAYAQGDLTAAQEIYDEGLNIFRELQDQRGLAGALSGMGKVVQGQGRYREAHVLFLESLGINKNTGSRDGIAHNLRELADLLLTESHTQKAIRLWAAASDIREKLKIPLPRHEQPHYELQVSQIRTTLGEEVFDAAWREGIALTWEQAVDYALEED